MSAAEQAALAKVRELEAKLAAIEADRVAAEQQAADEARKKLEAQAAARGRAVDPAELARAQDEARRKAQAEQEARLNAERQKLEEEKTRAEEQRRQAEEAARTEAQRSAVDAVAPPATAPSTPAAALGTPIPASAAPTAPVSAPSTSTPPPSTPAPSGAPTGVGTPPSALGPAGPTGPGPVAAGSGAVVLNPADPSVTPPQLVSQARPEYPPLARSQRVGGTVIISALIDEQGNVAEARVIRGVPGNMGLNEAALASVRKRKYKPAMSKGQPGRAWIAIQIDFKP
jgi:TonB family protein